MVLAVDIQPMRPLKGVTQIQGDITSKVTRARVRALLGESGADLVVCDGAPDVTGLHTLDEFCSGGLVSSALALAAELLRDGGTFVCKVLIGDAGRPYQQTLLYTQVSATSDLSRDAAATPDHS